MQDPRDRFKGDLAILGHRHVHLTVRFVASLVGARDPEGVDTLVLMAVPQRAHLARQGRCDLRIGR